MRVVLCTCLPADAERIARALLDAGAACVNVLPTVRSFYRWEGKTCDDAESLLVIKVATDRVPALETALRRVHPYQLPEWVVLPTDDVLTSEAYRAWVRDPS